MEGFLVFRFLRFFVYLMIFEYISVWKKNPPFFSSLYYWLTWYVMVDEPMNLLFFLSYFSFFFLLFFEVCFCLCGCAVPVARKFFFGVLTRTFYSFYI